MESPYVVSYNPLVACFYLFFTTAVWLHRLETVTSVAVIRH